MSEGHTVRRPAVAGMFYEGSVAALRRQLEALFLHPLGPGAAPQVNAAGEHALRGLISPHAGFVYSGAVAAHAYAALAADGPPDCAIIIGPDHRGIDRPCAISEVDCWQTPLGDLRVERELGRSIATRLDLPVLSAATADREHSLEVQLPFLRFLFDDAVSILPIVMADQRQQFAERLATALVDSLAGRRVVVIASTDLNHYLSGPESVRRDSMLIDAMLGGDCRSLQELVAGGMSMCGPGPACVALRASQLQGAAKVRLLQYANSGDSSGNYANVVGYAALSIGVD